MVAPPSAVAPPEATTRDSEADGGGEPRYIKACRENAWTLVTWSRKGDAPALRRQPARCRSWRHEGDCAEWRGAQDWRRISDALAHYNASDCVFMVFTLARSSSPQPPTEAELERWGHPAESWPALGGMLSAWLKRLNRMACAEHGACRWPELYYDGRGKLRQRWRCRGLCESHGSRWVSVVEQHRPKAPQYHAWPHLNVILVWPWLARQIRGWGRGLIERNGELVEDGRIPLGAILEHTVAAGFGYQSWANLASNTDGLASYIAKVAGETVGEISKLTQRPIGAPAGFRRLRSGRGFLPKPFASKSSGTLIGPTRDHNGNVVGYRCMARATDGIRTYVTHGPPQWCDGPMRWIDLDARVVYQPSWPGWKELREDACAFDIRPRPRGPPCRLVE